MALGFGLSLLAAVSASAGTFSANFNSLQSDPNDPNVFVPPDGTAWYGSIGTGISGGYDLRTGGVGNSGALKLTLATASQNSSFIVNNFDNGEVPVGFDVAFQLLIGGGNHADGISVAIGDFTDGAFAEEGPGSIKGLTVVFDIFNNGGAVAEAPAIDLKWNGVTFAHRVLPIGTITTLFPNAFVPVNIHANADGKVTLRYNNVVVYQDMPIYRADDFTLGNGWRVGFGARTGGSTDNQWIDDLVIATTLTDTSIGQPYITAISPLNPIDQNASSVGGVSVTLKDSTYSVDPSTVKLLYNGTAVAANLVTVTRTKSDPLLENPDQTLVTYFGVNGILPTGAATATIQYSTTSTPAIANSYAFNFTVVAATTIPVAYKAVGVDETTPGFKARVYQMDRWRSPGDQNITPVGERQLAMGFIDPTTHLPYPDVSNQDLLLLDANGYFDIGGVLNFEQTGGNAGQVSGASNPPRAESAFNGIAGNSTLDAGMGNFAMEFQGYIQLKAGGNRLGIVADDRVRFSFGPSFDAVGYAPQARTTGANVETIFDVIIPEDGFYPFRCSYWEGGGGASFELYWLEPGTGRKILVNDHEFMEAPRAFREATGARPWVKRVLPVEDWVGVFPNEKVLAEIVNGPTLAIDDSSVRMQINNVDQTITKVRNGRSLIVERPGSDSNLLPSGINTVRVIYNYTENAATVTKTNQYTFQTAPYYNAVPLGYKVPASDVNTAETGFNVRYKQLDRLLTNPNDQGAQGRISGGGDGNRMPNPEIHLQDGEINAWTGLPFPNIANPGPNGNYTDATEIINFNMTVAVATGVYANPASGFFQNGAPAAPLPGGVKPESNAPGLPSPSFDATRGVAAGNQNPSNGGLDNYVAEFTTYLNLKKGLHVFGVNSDDGFVCTTAPTPTDTFGTLLGFFHGGRGNKTVITDTEYAPWQNNVTATAGPPFIAPGQESGSSLFSVVVPEDGIYPIRLLYWNGGGGVNAEFYTVDQESGTYVLVNDLSATWGDGITPASNLVPAYRTYTGPAREWVKFSISPNPWDNRLQQSGPGPMLMYSHASGTATARRNAASADIHNGGDVYPLNQAAGNSAHWADVVIGAVVANAATGGVADPNLRLLVDDVEVPATKTVNGTDVTIAHKPNPLLTPGTHKATLVYAGVPNSWTFHVQKYTTINAADKATVAVDPTARGFSVKVAQASAARTGGNTAAAAENQLSGASGQANVAIPNAAEPDGRYILTGIVNLSNENANNPAAGADVGVGNFEKNIYGAGWPFPEFVDQAFPGLVSGGTGAAATREQFTAEIFAWLEIPAAGYYRFGGNADDAFFVKIGTPGVATGTVLFTQDRGAGNADYPFSFIAPEAGLYPVRFVYYQGTGGGSAEFFTYDENGVKIPVNDPNNPKAIKAYYKLQGAPTLSFAVSGGNLVLTWTAGATLQSTPALTVPTTWTDVGTSGTLTVPLPGPGEALFYRVKQ